MVRLDVDGKTYVRFNANEGARLGLLTRESSNGETVELTLDFAAWLTDHRGRFESSWRGGPTLVFDDHAAAAAFEAEHPVTFLPVRNPDGWMKMEAVERSRRRPRLIDELLRIREITEDEAELIERTYSDVEGWKIERSAQVLTRYENLGDGEWYEDTVWEVIA